MPQSHVLSYAKSHLTVQRSFLLAPQQMLYFALGCSTRLCHFPHRLSVRSSHMIMSDVMNIIVTHQVFSSHMQVFHTLLFISMEILNVSLADTVEGNKIGYISCSI